MGAVAVEAAHVARRARIGLGEAFVAAAPQAAERVRILDYERSPKRLSRLLSVCDLLVFPSLYEGMPNVLLEAMACGSAVVASDCRTGPREILGDSEHGLLIGDPLELDEGAFEAQLTQALERALDPAENARLRELASERARAFAPAAIVPRWLRALSG